jgi:hypothetical protein
VEKRKQALALAILVHQATKKKGVARKTKEKWKNESKPLHSLSLSIRQRRKKELQEKKEKWKNESKP